jgi:uncharacterized membrane protein
MTQKPPKPPTIEEQQHKQTAQHILHNQNPIKYILDTYNQIHVGDREIGELLTLSIITQTIRNSEGLQPKLSGESGKGKTDACKTIAHLTPEDTVINTSLSAKALYYLQLQKGKVVFSDDVNMSEDLETVLKQSTSNFQSTTIHTTVTKNRDIITLTIPPRMVWWLTSVDDNLSIEGLNRQIGVGIDDTPEQDLKVLEHQQILAAIGQEKYPETTEVQVCREIFKDLLSHEWTIIIPYAPAIEWRNPQNRRNFLIFLDLIKAYTAANYKQRIQLDTHTLVADLGDYEAAKKLYLGRAENQALKLTDSELKIIRLLTHGGEWTSKDLQKHLNISKGRVSQILNGKNGKSGLLSKVSQLVEEDVIDTEGEYRRVKKKVYKLIGNSGGLFWESFDRVLDLNENHEVYKAYIAAMKGKLSEECLQGLHSIYPQFTQVFTTINNIIYNNKYDSSEHNLTQKNTQNIIEFTPNQKNEEKHNSSIFVPEKRVKKVNSISGDPIEELTHGVNRSPQTHPIAKTGVNTPPDSENIQLTQQEKMKYYHQHNWQTPNELANDLNITHEEAETIIKKYKENPPR